MNSLNSILIEGELVEDPISKDEAVTFEVRFHRFFTKDSERKEETGKISVETWGTTAKLCLKTLAKGRGVRVVGRIKDVGDGKILVVGESVEFKTKFDKKA